MVKMLDESNTEIISSIEQMAVQRLEENNSCVLSSNANVVNVNFAEDM